MRGGSDGGGREGGSAGGMLGYHAAVGERVPCIGKASRSTQQKVRAVIEGTLGYLGLAHLPRSLPPPPVPPPPIDCRCTRTSTPAPRRDLLFLIPYKSVTLFLTVYHRSAHIGTHVLHSLGHVRPAGLPVGSHAGAGAAPLRQRRPATTR